MTTLQDGATSAEACVCDRQFVEDHTRGPRENAPPRRYCRSCAEIPGSNCSQANTTMRALPLLPGYWRPPDDSSDDLPFKCLVEASCSTTAAQPGETGTRSGSSSENPFH